MGHDCVSQPASCSPPCLGDRAGDARNRPLQHFYSLRTKWAASNAFRASLGARRGRSAIAILNPSALVCVY